MTKNDLYSIFKALIKEYGQDKAKSLFYLILDEIEPEHLKKEFQV